MDEEVGQRLADLRKRRGFRQEDFVRALKARGLDWAQGTLSRTESGKRPLRFSEAVPIADALGVGPADLWPGQGGLGGSIRSAMLRLDEAEASLAGVTKARDDTRSGLTALCLAKALTEGAEGLVVRGTPLDFVMLVAQWAMRESDKFVGLDRGLEVIGISHGQGAGPDDVESLVHAKYPELRFVKSRSRVFSVDGLETYVDNEVQRLLFGPDESRGDGG
ncbi:helix-turn-helix domain-containing protein [Rhodococcus hoagii]|nr:helix-turn-helix domain-containing protein [Prescottella equi]